MTLKTLTGPSIQHALADARRLFGDVVLLQSSPSGPGAPASVTVAFDDAPPPAPRPAPAAPALPDALAPATPRAYGYGAVRQVRPAAAEPFAAPAAPAPSAPAPLAALASETVEGHTETDGAPLTPALSPGEREPVESRADSETSLPTPAASGVQVEVEALRARLAELEATLTEVRASTPPPTPCRPPLVLVGRAGSGKTTLALRLAQSPALTGASAPAVLVVAPESGPFLDPAPSFWDAGVPVAVVRSADDVTQALRTFAEADLLIVDTPGLPVRAERARPAVARLGTLLAPLAAVDVALAVDASRPPGSLTKASLAALGLQPDALALTRLDETEFGPSAWTRHLDLPARYVSSGPGLTEIAFPPDAAHAAPPPPPAAPTLAAFASATNAETEPAPSPAASGARHPEFGFETLAELLDLPEPDRYASAGTEPACTETTPPTPVFA